MTKEEFSKVHLCKNCVNGCTDTFNGTLYHYCGLYIAHASCYTVVPLKQLYDTISTVTIRAVKNYSEYKEKNGNTNLQKQ